MRARLTIVLTLLLSIAVFADVAPAQAPVVRVIQTNAAGDNVHIIDPATQRVVAVIDGIPIAHGVTSHPDGRALYFSNETNRSLDIVPAATLKVAKQVPLSGRPNNVAITPDGAKVYVAIREGEALVEVVDLRTERVVKRIPTAGGVHNVYVTPDGRYAVAGMIGARTLTVIDTKTDEPLWSMTFDEGVRPIAFEKNKDGSTRRLFVQITNYHGFHVVDFATRAVTQKVPLPEVPITRLDDDGLQGSPAHGFAVAPDGAMIWSTSKPNNAVYAFSLPDLKYIGGVNVGSHPDWLTMTPDGRYLYSGNAGSNDVSVVDTKAMKEIVRIPVGQVPKRNHTALLAGLPNTSVAMLASAADNDLSFAVYRERVEPLLMKPRRGHGPGLSPCAACHAHSGTPMPLQPLSEDDRGQVYWTEAASRRNFDVVSRLVTPGNADSSRLLRKPLAASAGGTPLHVGGKFWDSKTDPEWQAIADWVRAARPTAPASAVAQRPLDFEFFRTCVQRIFLDKRPGRVECIHCHTAGERGFAQTIPSGRTFWNEQESRQNFEVLKRYIDQGFPMRSRFLTHPLAPEDGGDHMHAGGRRWASQDDPEWRMLAAWVRGEPASCVVPAP